MRFPEDALQSPPGREAIRVIDRLREAGFSAVLAGGCVRDALLGRTPKDFDVATDATPDSVQQVFGRRHTVAFGASFGVIGVLPPIQQTGKTDAKIDLGTAPTEVATFRADGNYSDGRRPDHVTYGTAEADAARRDFTINGLFYDPARGEILDYVGGVDDLRAMHLRTIGEADRRFDEDKLRMLRAVRFVTTLGLSVEPATWAAIRAHADTLSVVSGERIGAEMRRVIAHPGAVTGFRLLVETGLHRQVWPELASIDCERLQICYQNMTSRSFETGMATTLAVLHGETENAADPNAQNTDAENDAQNNLKRLTRAWKLATAEQRAITSAIRFAPQILRCPKMRWSELQPILVDRDSEGTLSVAAALAAISVDDRGGVQRAVRERARPAESLDPPPLLTGDDLVAAGFKPGPHFRIWLAEIRRHQLDDELRTSDEAMQWVKTMRDDMN